MKKIILIVILMATIFVQKSFAQNTDNQKQLSSLLTSYYQVKDALINGNSNMAARKAATFLKSANGISNRTLPEGNRDALIKDAATISDSKDLEKQREVFANFSANMYVLAKSLKLTAEPVYYQYCPMKKAYWLNSDKAIKNPYYGSAMLSCGQVQETIQ